MVVLVAILTTMPTSNVHMLFALGMGRVYTYVTIRITKQPGANIEVALLYVSYRNAVLTTLNARLKYQIGSTQESSTNNHQTIKLSVRFLRLTFSLPVLLMVTYLPDYSNTRTAHKRRFALMFSRTQWVTPLGFKRGQTPQVVLTTACKVVQTVWILRRMLSDYEPSRQLGFMTTSCFFPTDVFFSGRLTPRNFLLRNSTSFLFAL